MSWHIRESIATMLDSFSTYIQLFLFPISHHPAIKLLQQRLSLDSNMRNIVDLLTTHLTIQPLVAAGTSCLLFSLVCFVTSELNQNYSQVDRLWSLLPSVYNAHFAFFAYRLGLPTERLNLVLAISCIWSLRLTFNYYRKGGYNSGYEDYRWDILRKSMSRLQLFVFNAIFISLMQNILLLLITAPTYVILVTAQTSSSISTSDLVFACILTGLIFLEYLADQQQWDYQKAKRKYLETAKLPHNYQQEELERGFLITGLWSLCRHPNLAAEQAIWIFFYIWGCWDARTLYNWSSLGVISYILLIQASTRFTEQISAGKYRDYTEYQKRVWKFTPYFSLLFSEKSNTTSTKKSL